MDLNRNIHYISVYLMYIMMTFNINVEYFNTTQLFYEMANLGTSYSYTW